MKVILFSMLFILIGCSSVSKNDHLSNKWRGPSSSRDANCYELMAKIFNSRRQSSWTNSSIKNRLAQLKDVLQTSDASKMRDELSIMLEEVKVLKDEASQLDNEEALNLAISIYNNIQQIQSKNGGNFSSFLTEKLPWLSNASEKLFSIVGFSRASKKEKALVALDDAFGKDIARINSKSLNEFSDGNLVKDEISKLSYLNNLKDPRRAVTKRGKDFDYDLFDAWISSPGNVGHFDIESNRTIKDLYIEIQERFLEASANYTKKEKQKIFDLAKEQNVESYNKLIATEIGDIETASQFKENVYQLMSHFRKFEDRFRDFDFEEKWLRKNDFFSEDNFNSIKLAAEGSNKTIGEIIEKEYIKFAPYSEIPLKVDKKLTDRMKDGMMRVVGRIQNEVDSCKTPTCIFTRVKDKFSVIFKQEFYTNKFSCMVKNPLVIKNMVIELSIAWSAIYIYYKENKELFERFPYELIVNGAVFAPIMNEANCRASFKGNIPFGRFAAHSEVFPSNSKKIGRYLKNLKSLSIKGSLSTLGLIGFTWGFDHLALSMGQAITRPLDLSEIMKTLPFLLLYNGVWNNMKGLAIVNPIRHKIIPKFAKIFKDRFKIPGSSLILQSGLDFGFFYYISKYNSWEYLSYYKESVLPGLMAMFGIKQASDEEERENSDFNNGRSSDVTIEDEVIQEDEENITYESKLSNGVETKLVMQKQADGTIKIVEVDVDAPDSVIEEAAESIIQK